MTTALADFGKSCQYLANLIKAGKPIDAFLTDLAGHDRNRARLPVPVPDSTILSELLVSDDESLRLLRAIASHFVIPAPVLPSGTWTFTQHGNSFSGRSPMPASIVDTDAAWGVSVTNLKDARGENPAPGATIALTVDDADVVTITDNGDGTGTVVSGPLATSTTPASTAIHAMITNADGTTFAVDDVITIVGSDAVTGDFGFTPPA